MQGVEPPPLLYPGVHAAAKHRLTFPLTYSFLHKHVQNILYAFKNYLLTSFTTFPCLFCPRNTIGGGVVGKEEDEYISPISILSGELAMGPVSDVWVGGSCHTRLLSALSRGPRTAASRSNTGGMYPHYRHYAEGGGRKLSSDIR